MAPITKLEGTLLELPPLSIRTYATTVQEMQEKQEMIRIRLEEARKATLEDLGIIERTSV